MRHFFALIILASFILSACAPASGGAEATLVALSIQLTVDAQLAGQATEAPTATPTLAAATPTNTLVPSATAQSTATETLEPSPTPFVVPEWPLFRSGDEGPEVYAIQHLLRAHGYNLTVDGKFGPQTRTEVQSFQTAKGIGADGIVGPQTWAALINGKMLDEGDSGQAVRALQVLLHDKFGYTDVDVDADFGPLTREAVEDFQAAYDLTVDGIVGLDTWQALVAIEP